MSLAGALCIVQIVVGQPVISSVSPLQGKAGSTVTITGSGFNTTASLNTVYFGAVSAPVVSASATVLKVTAPAQATYAPVSVTTGNLTDYSRYPFVVNFNPVDTITSSSFGSRQDVGLPTAPQATAIADFDGDGKPDVATICYTANRLSVLRNTSVSGTISFAARIDSITGSSPNEIGVADIDGDGKLDVFESDFDDGTFSVFRNTSSIGSISFAARVIFTVGSSPSGLAAADIDGDGKPDIAVPNQTAGTISVLRNTSTPGTISFATPITLTNDKWPGLPHTIAFGDLDGDGKPELAVTNIDVREVTIYRNTSTPGTIVLTQIAGIQFQPDSLHAPLFVAMGDLDRDGKVDMAVTDTAVSVFVVRNLSSGVGNFTFGTPVRFFKGQGVGAVTIADVDGDARPDLTAGNARDNTISIYKNLSSPGSLTASSFAPRVDFASESYPIRIAVGDLDGDSHPDLAIPNYLSTTVTVWRNLSVNGYVNVNFAAWLEGPYVSVVDTMLLTLRKSAAFAAHFAGVPVPARAVDSITVELRDNANHTPGYRHFAPAWLMSDGFVRDFRDTTHAYVTVDSVMSGSANYIVVRHRNHLAVMTAAAQVLTDAPSPAWYDFTSSTAALYGGASGTKFVTPSYVMIAGDGNGSGIVTAADANAVFGSLNVAGYLGADVNLTGIVTAADANFVFLNLNLATALP